MRENNDLEEIIKGLAYCTLLMRGIRNVKFSHYWARESHFGPFPKDIDSFTKDWMAMQGIDLDWLRRDREVIIEVNDFRFASGIEKLLLVVIYWKDEA